MSNSIEDLIKEALSKFPNVNDEVGFDKVMKAYQRNQYSPLVYNLKKSLVSEEKIQNALTQLKKTPGDSGVLIWLDMYLENYWTIRDLDEYISELKGLSKFKSVINHLVNDFWSGYAELEVAYYLKKLFENIELEPKLSNGKSVDVSFHTEDTFYVEVISPKRSPLSERMLQKSAEQGKAVELPDTTDRACDKITAELDHFKDIIKEIKTIVIIDLKRSDFDEIEIEDCLMGISNLVIMKNTNTGKFIGTKVERDAWTGFDYDERLKHLGAVICYNKQRRVNGGVKINKKIFNINLTEEETDTLLELFNI